MALKKIASLRIVFFEKLVILSMSLSTVSKKLRRDPSDGLKQHSCTGVLYKRVDENYCSWNILRKYGREENIAYLWQQVKLEAFAFHPW